MERRRDTGAWCRCRPDSEFLGEKEDDEGRQGRAMGEEREGRGGG